MLTTARRRLGVCGWPVAHSRSPAMHGAALAALGLDDWAYQKLPIPPDAFAETVRALPALGFVGVNVTIPHKEAALALATTATDAARAIGAANTLTFGADGAIEAENTDAPGFLDAAGDVTGARALVLGAGGSARAVVHALVQGGAEDVQVWNRTPERAHLLTAQLGGRAVIRPDAADLIVNCTSVGLEDDGDPFKRLPLDADTFATGISVVDLVYRDDGTTFLAAARSRGAVVVDGLEVLVGQGARSLERWTGRPAPRDVMRRAARAGSPRPTQ